jgi:two-component system OmpR family sensor kinase
VPSDIDPDAVAIIVRNLIENALRHGQGAVAVTLDQNGSLCVQNDCPPIPSDELAALSGRFVRGKKAGDGSGLGLAIVHTIAERIGTPLRLTSPLPGKTSGFSACISLHGTTPFQKDPTQ